MGGPEGGREVKRDMERGCREQIKFCLFTCKFNTTGKQTNKYGLLGPTALKHLATLA